MYFLSCVAVFGRYTSELENWNASIYWGGLHVPLAVPVCRDWGGDVYDLNIESKINLAGNAIIKIYVIDYKKY